MYGSQGWWPLIEHNGTNPTKSGSIQGYHPNDYSFPKTKKQQFEICVGAILTQNTNFSSVEKSLINLNKHNLLKVDNLLNASEENIKQIITPSGYQNQKTKYLKVFASFFSQLSGRIPSRKDLLDLKGIGPETADAILLYAFAQPEFVIDVYTKRVFQHFGILENTEKYEDWKNFFHESLQTEKQKIQIYQEYHALIVEHAKRYYVKKPHGTQCPLKKFLQTQIQSK